MKIISYSDLHLEFGADFLLPPNSYADVLVLAGDIISFQNYKPLSALLDGWNKPVLYVIGNHEYYRAPPMRTAENAFIAWLAKHFPNVRLLQNAATSIDGIHFFGGTMWTDFSHADLKAMQIALRQMNDFQLIRMAPGECLTPAYTVQLHHAFVESLTRWLALDLAGPRIIITHHSPVINPQTQYGASPLQPAFNALDMVAVIEKFQPSLWIYGHTHECDRRSIGRTQIISNQRGYPRTSMGFQCHNFDERGALVEIEAQNGM